MTREQTFSYNGATVVVRESLGIDRIDRQLVFQKLTYNRDDERDINRAIRFADFLMRAVTVEGDLSYPWASLSSDAAAIQAAYEAWVQWPTSLMDVWMAALYEVNETPGDAATQPDIDPNG